MIEAAAPHPNVKAETKAHLDNEALVLVLEGSVIDFEAILQGIASEKEGMHHSDLLLVEAERAAQVLELKQTEKAVPGETIHTDTVI